MRWEGPGVWRVPRSCVSRAAVAEFAERQRWQHGPRPQPPRRTEAGPSSGHRMEQDTDSRKQNKITAKGGLARILLGGQDPAQAGGQGPGAGPCARPSRTNARGGLAASAPRQPRAGLVCPEGVVAASFLLSARPVPTRSWREAAHHPRHGRPPAVQGDSLVAGPQGFTPQGWPGPSRPHAAPHWPCQPQGLTEQGPHLGPHHPHNAPTPQA